MTAPHCFTCRYWLERGIHTGQCRRYPPSANHSLPTSDDFDFPYSCRNDWCGEHQDKHAGREAA